MSDTNRAALLSLLVASYDDLRSRLVRRAGSAELADEALQDTFLRLSNATGIGPVRDLKAYLFRVALSIVSNRRVAERRRRTVSEGDAVFEMVDDRPGPDRVIEARSEIGALKRVISEMPARRREMFMATFVDEVPLRETALRFGVSVRTVQVELKQALVHCAARLQRTTQDSPPLRPRNHVYQQGRALRAVYWTRTVAVGDQSCAATPDEPL